jgi:hypothetical protein
MKSTTARGYRTDPVARRLVSVELFRPRAPIRRGHRVVVTWRGARVSVDFCCYEPPGAWCRRHTVGPGEPPPENPCDCWFTVLASGFDWLSIYAGHPAEIDPVHSGAVEFERTWPPDSSDECEWRYVDPERKT